MTEKLRKCPFCGGDAELIEHTDGSGGIYCKKCKFTPLTHHFGRYSLESKQEVINWWNTRAEDENPELTLDKLREMDGEPVWCVDGAGNECWCIVNVRFESCIDNDTGKWDFDFYALPGSDGLHGLNKHLGWLAYRRKPEVKTEDE